MDTSKCYATTKGRYLGRFNNTRSVPDGGLGALAVHNGGLATVHNFENGDRYESTFRVVDCKPVGSPNVEYVVVNSEGKRTCPFCNAVEGGKEKIIIHDYDCENKKGGRKNANQQKNRRRTRRSSRKNRRRTRRSNNN